MSFAVPTDSAFNPAAASSEENRVATPSSSNVISRNAKEFTGVKAAKRASSYLIKGSASPMESLLSMLLCLPPSLGGFGLPRPELNYPIETNEGSVAMRRCDLCWPDQRFALEYDSDTFHSDASKLHLDSSRRSALEKAGIHVVSVTKNQVFDRGQLFNLATIASKRLGKRLSPTPFNFAQKQDEIYQAVFK